MFFDYPAIAKPWFITGGFNCAKVWKRAMKKYYAV
jgi:hypothetical protein